MDNIFHITFANISSMKMFECQLKFSLKDVPNGSTNNIPALVSIKTWCRPGNKPLSEPIMVRLPPYICITWPQWVNTSEPEQNGCHYADWISQSNFFYICCPFYWVNSILDLCLSQFSNLDSDCLAAQQPDNSKQYLFIYIYFNMNFSYSHCTLKHFMI